MAVSSVEREHLNLLCVFPREAELKVATVIFEGGTDSTFDLDTRFSQLGLRICRGWKSEPASGELTIGFVSQTKTGSDGCTKRLSQVAECFTPDLVVMAGVCAGAEDLTSGCQHGCVVIVNKATRMGEGIKSKGCKYPNVDAEYVELDSELVSWIAPLTEIEEPEWLKLIPKALWCPSPRSAREMIIKMLDSNPGMPKKRILEECNRIQETKEFGAMNGITWGLILNRMEKDTNPWIKVVDEDLYTLENTKRSISYYNGAHHPLGTDRIQAFLGTMGTMEHQIGDLASEIDDLRPAMGAHSLIAVDQEAYDFIKLCQDRFKQSLCVVVKGISERCISAHGRLTPFQKFAACTPVAWLRFFVTKHQQHLFKSIKPIVLPSIELDYKNDKVVETVLKAVQRYAATRAVAIGRKMGLTMDRIQGLIHHLVEPADQIMVIFEAQAGVFSRSKAAQQLLEACKEEIDILAYEKVLNYIQQHIPTSK